MHELIALELITGLFLVLPLQRSRIKRLQPLEGLIWLPPLALIAGIALFPAYGFRPECIPLLILVLAVNIGNLRGITARFFPFQSRYQERGAFLPVLGTLLAVAVCALGIIFSPSAETALIREGITALSLRDGKRNETLFLRIYGPLETQGAAAGRKRPVMILVPPVQGSVFAVDRFGDELRRIGFTVIAFSREGFDSPAVNQAGKRLEQPLARRLGLLRVHLRGGTYQSANAAAREMEAGKAEDTVFLLDYIKSHQGIPGFLSPETDFQALFITGFYTGGAALTLLAGSPEFIARHGDPAGGVRGIIAVEAPPLSVLEEEAVEPADSFDTPNWFQGVWGGFRAWLASLGPKRITRIGTVPSLGLPVCFILSDRVYRDRDRNGRYKAALRIFQASRQPAVLASLDGAGILDYSDIPQKYPLYAFFFPGNARRVLPRRDMSRHAAALATNFSRTFLEPDTAAAAQPLPGRGFRIESNGAWNSLDRRYILNP
ncbi:MAG: hypothetical protein LBD37_10550 [Treponema sp.]|jgi:hypothetical protein|nr:hypothetical protein [Treponema sp.]